MARTASSSRARRRSLSSSGWMRASSALALRRASSRFACAARRSCGVFADGDLVLRSTDVPRGTTRSPGEITAHLLHRHQRFSDVLIQRLLSGPLIILGAARRQDNNNRDGDPSHDATLLRLTAGSWRMWSRARRTEVRSVDVCTDLALDVPRTCCSLQHGLCSSTIAVSRSRSTTPLKATATRAGRTCGCGRGAACCARRAGRVRRRRVASSRWRLCARRSRG